MSELTLFEGSEVVKSDLYKSLQDTNSNLLGGSNGSRISIRGGKFRQIVGGDQVHVSKEDTLNMVIVDSAKIARTYYEGDYDPEKTARPKCWSADTQIPSSDVPEEDRMAPRCADCSMNIKGSGQGESRACRYSQRLAIVLEGEFDKVQQLQLPATSLFGDAKDGNMGMQAYARLLHAHDTPAIAVVTEMRFDENSDTPKLFFKPSRPLTEEELAQVVAHKDSEDVLRAITMTVSNADNTPAAAEKAAPAKKAKKAKKAEVAEEVTIEEPEKKAKKAAAPEVDPELDELLDSWDD